MMRSRAAKNAFWLARRSLGSKLVEDASVPTLGESSRWLASGNRCSSRSFFYVRSIREATNASTLRRNSFPKRFFHGTQSLSARDYYDVIGVNDQNASAADHIKKAYYAGLVGHYATRLAGVSTPVPRIRSTIAYILPRINGVINHMKEKPWRKYEKRCKIPEVKGSSGSAEPFCNKSRSLLFPLCLSGGEVNGDMAEYDEGKKRSNGVADGDEEGVRGPIEIELDPVTPGGGETLYSVLRDFFAGVVSPPPPALLQRIKSSASESAPRLQEASRNSARNLCLWTRRGGPLRALFVISVGTITLLALTGLLIFFCFLFTATLNAVIVSLLLSLAAAGGFLAIFFACLTAIYIGALSFAVFIISTTTISAIIAVFVATGWIGFFWLVWLAVKKSVDLTKKSVSMTSSAVSAYSTAWQAKRDLASKRD